MPDMREKLVELLMDMPFGNSTYEEEERHMDNIADYLIANGVTNQRWIPVTERLPDTQEYDWVLAQITLKPSCIYGVPVVAELRGDGIWYDAYDNQIDGKYEKITHWMPLPEPPKEDE